MSVQSRLVTVYWVTCDVPGCKSVGPEYESQVWAIYDAVTVRDFSRHADEQDVCKLDDEAHRKAREAK